MSNLKAFLAVATLGGVCLLIGGGLQWLRASTESKLQAAEDWAKVPCRIESSGFEQTDGEEFLTIVFSYRVRGKKYQSDQPDLLAGSAGDERGWERELHAANPAGAETFCFVDPDSPQNAVLDRVHGRDGLKTLNVLSVPFLAIGSMFCLLIVIPVLCGLTGRLISSPGLPDGSTRFFDLSTPRPVPFLRELVILLAEPTKFLVAWGFLVGFFFVYWVLLEGETAWKTDTENLQSIEGTVTHVFQEDGHELGRPTYRYEFRFVLNEETIQGSSFVAGNTPLDEGDPVEIEYDPSDPQSARIRGMRRESVPAWVRGLFGLPLPLLAIGLIGTLRDNFRLLGLLRRGELGDAERVESSPPRYRTTINAANFDVRVAPHETPDGNQTHGRVLFHPRSPRQNVLLESLPQSWRGQADQWPTQLPLIFVGPVAVGLIVWMLI